MSEIKPAAPVIQRLRRISPVWIIPIVAALVAGFLVWRTVSREGPTITITFLSGDGLTAGQTNVKHKAVDLGTVRSIVLSPDMSHVIVRVEMQREAAPVLTDHARFWVVRPRLTPSNISGLETLVSGSYIELDPGAPGGEGRREFTGLEEPPAVRSDEPGRSFTLKSAELGSLATGSLVVYRGINVGEVLGYDQVRPGQPISVHAFIRSPYDQYVHEGSYFWNDSGFDVDVGASGISVKLQSLQAVVAGAVAFDTPAEATATPVAANNAEFPLFKDQATASAAHFRDRLPFVVHFKESVRGLSVGAPVMIYGIQIGTVTAVQLNFNPQADTVDAPVRIEMQPERFMAGMPASRATELQDLHAMVAKGLRVQLQSASLITGQQFIALDFFPDPAPGDVSVEGNDIVLPTEPAGDLSNITRSAAALMRKLESLPLDQVANSLNSTLKSVNALASGPDLKNALQSLSTTLITAQELIKRVDAGLTPAMKRLPDIAEQLQNTLDRVNKLVVSVDGGYGQNSDLRRDLDRLVTQTNDTARSIRLLADFLDQHPEALLRGRTATER
jgi:paraquat-inducible protein B